MYLRGGQWLRLSSFSYDYWRDFYTLVVLGVSRQHSPSALLKIPSFCLCDLRDCHLMLSLLVTVGVGWSSLFFSWPCYDVRGRIHSSRDLYPQLVELQAFSSFNQWL